MSRAGRAFQLVLAVTILLTPGCGATQWDHVLDKAPEIALLAKPYLDGCADVTLAPMVSVGYAEAKVGVGALVGCREYGPLLEVFCWLVGERKCTPVRLWYIMEEQPINACELAD